MGVAGDLVGIYVKYLDQEKGELTLENFCLLPQFKVLEQNAVVIEQIEAYHLPEITYLICASETLSALPWAKRYAAFKSYCLKANEIDVRVELDRASELREFIDKLLFLEYEPVIVRFSKFFKDMAVKRKDLMDEIKTVENTLKKEQKAAKERAVNIGDPDAVIESEVIVALKTKKDKLKEQEEEQRKFLEKYKMFLERIEEYLMHCKSENVKAKREEMFAKLTAIESELGTVGHAIVEEQNTDNVQEAYDNSDVQTNIAVAESLDLLETGVISEELHKKLQEDNASKWLLDELEQEEYCNKALPILLKLHEEGEIDLEQEDYMRFISQNKEELCRYLAQEYVKDCAVLQDDNKNYFYEYAVRLECDGVGGSFSVVWNLFTCEESWKWLLAVLRKLEPDDYDKYIYKFFIGLTGDAADLVAKLMAADGLFSVVIKPLTVMAELLANSPLLNRQVIYCYLQLQDKHDKELSKRIRHIKHQLNAQSQELFANIYKPVEELEGLAVDLRYSAEVDSKLVADKLMEYLVLLRKNLINIGIEPILDENEWCRQEPMVYDAQRHRMMAAKGKKGKVKARTMGFSYYDDEGVLQSRVALVHNTETKKIHSKTDVQMVAAGGDSKKETRTKIDTYSVNGRCKSR